MKVKLLPEAVLEAIPNEELLSEDSKLNIIYNIRKLKCLIKSMSHGFIELTDKGYSEEFQIYFNEFEYHKV